MRACVCVLIILPFYLPLRKQQKAARAGWSLRSGADSQPLPWAEGWGGGLFFFCVCGGVVVRRRGPPGCFSVFRVKLCQPQSPPGCGKEEPPRSPGGAGDRLGFVPVPSPGSVRCCGSGRAPPWEGPWAEPGGEGGCRPRPSFAARSSSVGRATLCFYFADFAEVVDSVADSETVKEEARTALPWVL